MPTPAEKRAEFRRLHESGCFVIPNPWDAGSARILQGLGFQALASTSSGMAWSKGLTDYEVELGDVLDHLTMLCAATDLPLNADFENGFADDPEGVGGNVARALEAGVAGLSIEDTTRRPGKPVYETAEAVARIRAARAAIDAEGSGAVLVGRADGLLMGHMDAAQAIERLTALADAGADCLYAPGLRTKEDIAACVRAVAPKPVNVLIGWPGLTVAELADLGVRRVSVGGALAGVAYAALIEAAREIADQGSFDAFGRGVPRKEIGKLLKL
jgi:2-methylisocitrate lyase-like PEP mutase family enzyme